MAKFFGEIPPSAVKYTSYFLLEDRPEVGQYRSENGGANGHPHHRQGLRHFRRRGEAQVCQAWRFGRRRPGFRRNRSKHSKTERRLPCPPRVQGDLRGGKPGEEGRALCLFPKARSACTTGGIVMVASEKIRLWNASRLNLAPGDRSSKVQPEKHPWRQTIHAQNLFWLAADFNIGGTMYRKLLDRFSIETAWKISL